MDYKLEWKITRFHNLSNSTVSLGNLENAIALRPIIFITKKIIYDAMKKEQKLHILGVKNDVKNIYFQEKYDIRGNKRVLLTKTTFFYQTYMKRKNKHVTP